LQDLPPAGFKLPATAWSRMCASRFQASHRIPVERMLPLILSLPLRLPMRLAQSPPRGINLATGRPCFVMTMPSGPTRSSNARHCSLNLAAGMVFAICAVYHWTEKVSSLGGPALHRAGASHLPAERLESRRGG